MSNKEKWECIDTNAPFKLFIKKRANLIIHVPDRGEEKQTHQNIAMYIFISYRAGLAICFRTKTPVTHKLASNIWKNKTKKNDKSSNELTDNDRTNNENLFTLISY